MNITKFDLVIIKFKEYVKFDVVIIKFKEYVHRRIKEIIKNEKSNTTKIQSWPLYLKMQWHQHKTFLCCSEEDAFRITYPSLALGYEQYAAYVKTVAVTLSKTDHIFLTVPGLATLVASYAAQPLLYAFTNGQHEALYSERQQAYPCNLDTILLNEQGVAMLHQVFLDVTMMLKQGQTPPPTAIVLRMRYPDRIQRLRTLLEFIGKHSEDLKPQLVFVGCGYLPGFLCTTSSLF